MTYHKTSSTRTYQPASVLRFPYSDHFTITAYDTTTDFPRISILPMNMHSANARHIILTSFLIFIQSIGVYGTTFPRPSVSNISAVVEVATWCGGGIIERKVVLSQYNYTDLEGPSPKLYPTNRNYIQDCKISLGQIIPSFLDNTITNASGVFECYTNRHLAAYSNRFWTSSNIIQHCELPVGFFTNSPQNYRYHGTNDLFGWEGIRRIIKELKYIESAAWYVESTEGHDYSYHLESYSMTSNYCGDNYTFHAPTPILPLTNTMDVVYARVAGGTEILHVINDSFVYWEFDDYVESIQYGWGWTLNYKSPSVLMPGASAGGYGGQYFPTNSLDLQTFYRTEGAYNSNGTCYAAAQYGKHRIFLGELPCDAAENEHIYAFHARTSGTLLETDMATAVVNLPLGTSIFSENLLPSTVYVPVSYPCWDANSLFGHTEFGQDYECGWYAGTLLHELASPPKPGNNFYEGFGAGICSEDYYASRNTYIGGMHAFGFIQDSVIMWNWKFK